MIKKKENNIAFIDGQNLYLGTQHNSPGWKINLKKLRKYLYQKYDVQRIYYFLGYPIEENETLYTKIQEAGYILCFRLFNLKMIADKKGNVDSDIIFNIMKKLYLKEDFDKVLIVAGDGDYKMLIDFLIEENKFKKILFPNDDYYSSLYKDLGNKYYSRLNRIKQKIME